MKELDTIPYTSHLLDMDTLTIQNAQKIIQYIPKYTVAMSWTQNCNKTAYFPRTFLKITHNLFCLIIVLYHCTKFPKD